MAWQSAQHTLGAPLGYRSTLRQPWHTIWLCIPGAAAAAAGEEVEAVLVAGASPAVRRRLAAARWPPSCYSKANQGGDEG